MSNDSDDSYRGVCRVKSAATGQNGCRFCTEPAHPNHPVFQTRINAASVCQCGGLFASCKWIVHIHLVKPAAYPSSVCCLSGCLSTSQCKQLALCRVRWNRRVFSVSLQSRRHLHTGARDNVTSNVTDTESFLHTVTH